MKKLIALAAGIRLNAVPCAAAAVLLNACGAGVSDPVNGPQSQTAVELTGAARPAVNNAAAMPYSAEATAAVAGATMPTIATATPLARATAPSAPAAATNIEPACDSKRQSAGTTGFSDQTEAPVEVAQETAPPACDGGACQH